MEKTFEKNKKKMGKKNLEKIWNFFLEIEWIAIEKSTVGWIHEKSIFIKGRF